MSIITYFLIGCVFYLSCCAVNKKSFRNADRASIARGFIFGVIFWPIAMIYVAWRVISG